MINQEQLSTIPDGKIFHTCVTESHAVRPIGEDKPVETMFVFKKGDGGNDWAVYALPTEQIYARWDSVYETMVTAVKRAGTKVTQLNYIKQLLPMEEECFKTYRL